jgi:RNA polymerase-associated protein
MGVVAKRSSMTFYSDPDSHYSHRVRIVLAEKGVTVDINDVEGGDVPQEVTDVNPYNNLPTLIDRDLVLYEPNVMMEYLDERFPHPPLLPVYPVERAKCRLFMHRVEKDWSLKVDVIEARKDRESVAQAQKELADSISAISPIFKEKPYFMNDEFTIVDCVVAPILWRLPHLGVELSAAVEADLKDYMERVFTRESFVEALSENEKEMRDPL